MSLMFINYTFCDSFNTYVSSLSIINGYSSLLTGYFFINYYISKSLNLGVSILKFLFILPSPSSYIS